MNKITGFLRLNKGENILSYDIDNHGNNIFMKINLDGKEVSLDGFDIFNLKESCDTAIKSIKKLKTSTTSRLKRDAE